MSYSVSHPSYSQFEVIFHAALKEYAQNTGTDLTTHPLADAFEACDSPEDILDVLHSQARAFDRYQDRVWTIQLVRHLEPTISILVGLSTGGIFAEGIGLVRFPCMCFPTLICLPTQVSTSEGDIYWNWSPTRSVYLLPPLPCAIVTAKPSRRPREPFRATMHLSNSSNVSNTTFGDSEDLHLLRSWRQRHW